MVEGLGLKKELLFNSVANYHVTGESCDDVLQAGHCGVQVVWPPDKDRKFYPEV
jgi:hypothetical protein